MTIIIDIFVVTCLVAIDQFSKSLIVSYFKLNTSKTIIDGFFNLTYVQNFGAGFSIMQNSRTTFLILTPICVALFVYLLYKSNNKFEKSALLMMIGGSIGNFIDRLVNSYVVDFLDFNIFGWDFPVFNFADICLTVGTIIFIIVLFKEGKNA